VDRGLLDTDAFSEVLKGVNVNVVARATQYQSEFGAYTISTITVVEIVKGFHKVQREDRLRKFLEGLSAAERLSKEEFADSRLECRVAPDPLFRAFRI
jgi:tRNA(fMet)-specific endonuclease VapC